MKKLSNIIAIFAIFTFISCGDDIYCDTIEDYDNVENNEEESTEIICPPKGYEIRHDKTHFLWRYGKSTIRSIGFETYNAASESAWAHSDYIDEFGNPYIKPSNIVPCMEGFYLPEKDL